MIIEIFSMILLGIATGTISGLLPGVGVTVGLLVLFPFILGLDPVLLIVLYTAMISSSQYMGSVMATICGVPGETSSLPAVKEGHRMFLNGRGQYAISGCAIGSAVGSFISIIFTVTIIGFVISLFGVFNNSIQVFVLVASAMAMIILAHNKIWQSALLWGGGYFLAAIGVHVLTEEKFMVFDILWLYNGLPLFPVVIALYVIPELIKSSVDVEYKSTTSMQSEKFINHFKMLIKHWRSVVRGSAIGYWCGLVPHLTTELASNLAYSVERKQREKSGKYDLQGDYPSLVSAETANNAAAFTCLLPLLLIGVPITTSEAILYQMITSSGMVLGFSHFINSDLIYIIGFSLIVINILCIFVAWPFAKYIEYVNKIPLKWLNIGIFCLLVFLVGFVGSQVAQMWYYLTVLAVLAPIGVLLRKRDTLPLIFGFILQDLLEAVFFRAMILWF